MMLRQWCPRLICSMTVYCDVSFKMSDVLSEKCTFTCLPFVVIFSDVCVTWIGLSHAQSSRFGLFVGTTMICFSRCVGIGTLCLYGVFKVMICLLPSYVVQSFIQDSAIISSGVCLT